MVKKVLDVNCTEEQLSRYLKLSNKKGGWAVRKIKEESAESFSCGLT